MLYFFIESINISLRLFGDYYELEFRRNIRRELQLRRNVSLLILANTYRGFFEAMLVWDIKSGHLNDVKLDGLKVSIWLHAPGPQLTEGGFKIALYIDENATDEQAAALEELYGGKHGGHLGVIASLLAKLWVLKEPR